MRLGVCYYPEHWPEDRWARDAAWFRGLGLSIVRMAEFGWGRMEPVQGRFAWDWLDRAVEAFAAEGFEVVLGTPTAAPPRWLSAGDPSTLPVDAEGRRRRPGGRHHYCPSSPSYREHVRRIVSAMADRYGDHPAVAGWQVDNEIGESDTARCYCAICGHRFADWLRERYGSLEALNAAWGAVFWSGELTDWGQAGPPILSTNLPNPSAVLDYRRFQSAAYADYERLQVGLLRERIPPGRWVTHNFMGLFPDIDSFGLAAPLDFATWDSYPMGNLGRWRRWLYGDEPPDGPWAYDVGDPVVTGFAHDLTYGLLDAPFWVMEQAVGHINWAAVNAVVRPGTVRLWCWHAAAHGADALVFFRDRAVRYAQEQYHSGLMTHDGAPGTGVGDVERLRGELGDLASLTAARPPAEVALLFSYADLWAIELQPHHHEFTYLRSLFAWYRALARMGVPVAVRPVDADLSGHRAILAPTLHLADDALAARLRAAVDGGAALLLGVRSGMKGPSNLVVDEPFPGPLRALTRTRVGEWGALPAGVEWTVESELPSVAGPARVWVEALEPEGAEVVARYADGRAALTRAGRVWHCGWLPGVDQAAAVLRALGVEARATLPPGVVAGRRGARDVLLNFTDGALEAAVGGRSVTVGPRDVALLDEG